MTIHPAQSRTPAALGEVRGSSPAATSPQQSASALLHQRSRAVDSTLRRLWQSTSGADAATAQELTLAAVGGYGRGTLFPHSDIDLLILTPPTLTTVQKGFIEGFLTSLWDLQMQVGHSVRSVDECLQEARQDLGIATTLLESRYLAGSHPLLQQLSDALRENPPWPSPLFFAAKLAEQENRHARCSDTAFHLEPNLKEGPGALRNIHHLQWLAASVFGEGSLRRLRDEDIITGDEYRQLLRAQALLSRLRIALHLATGRHEDRLRLDLQVPLARQLGYTDRPGRTAVEQLMQKLYRAFADILRIAAIAQENIAQHLAARTPALEVTDQRATLSRPTLHRDDIQLLRHILGLFRSLVEDPRRRTLDAQTQRHLYALRNAVHPRDLDHDPVAQEQLLAILAQPDGAYRSLAMMQQCGLLARILPAFGRITGRIQHDLFHAYTVDQHTLFLLRNLGQIWTGEAPLLPVAEAARRQVEKPELLVLAGLFHDIGKGRGGDHSKIGAQEARRFARRLRLSPCDTDLVVWLVEQHLRMSAVSQRRDLEDPQVIRDFAHLVGDERHLAYLLLLTVADMRATNPELWNDWKGLLLSTLYRATATELQREDRQTRDLPQIISDKQQAVLQKIASTDHSRVHTLWQQLSGPYFLRYTADELLWHCREILAHKSRKALVAVRPHAPEGSEVLIYGPDRPGLFQQITGALDRQSLNIIDARIDTSEDGRAIDTFLVIDNSHAFAHSAQAHADLAAELRAVLEGEAVRKPRFGLRHCDPRHRFFAHVPAEIRVDNGVLPRYTLLEVRAADHLGLLYQVGETLRALQLNIHGAKVSTFGERVEDTFFILNERGRKLTETQVGALIHALSDILNGEPA